MIIRTVCQGCHPECGVLVTVKNGKVTRIAGDPDHPSSRGFICVKGRSYTELLYHPDRLLYPQKRAGAKASGKWQRISWDQALGEIAEQLTAIKDKYGPEAISVFHGTGPRSSGGAVRRLSAALGTANIVNTDLHICIAPSIVAETFTVGHSIMMDRGPDYLSAKCIMVMGGNPVASHAPRGVEILEARRKNGAKLIVVDPRLIPLAKKADLWLQIRPGTDGALALAMLHTIITEELYDRDFVSKWCHGFEELKERVKDFSPEKMAPITWLPSEKIREAARLYATTKPAVMHHRVAIEHNVNSTQTCRALINMVAITGNLDVPGGNLLPGSGGAYPNRHRQFSVDPEVEEKRIGYREFPLISGREAPLPFVHCSLAADAMLTGKPYPLKAMYLGGGNPVTNMQNGRKIWEALLKLELFVVTDFFMTPTAELADYVLPAATWLERDEFCETQYLNCFAARQKALEPLGETLDDRDMVIELVKRLPWANRELLPWKSSAEWNESTVKDRGITFADLKRQGYVSVPRQYKQYEESGFRTPTGKAELYCTTFEKYGYDPLPGYKEPPHSPISTPELMKDYPLVLISGARYIEYFHSMGRQIPTLRRRVPDPVIEVHPETAKRLGLRDGDWVWVRTPQIPSERVRLKVTVTDGIDPRVVHAAHGWWFPEKPAPEHGAFDSNISITLDDDPHGEPVCGSVPVRGTLCRIDK
ncbi:MAG: molybdopterin-dependent oxidoreductase [Chloroflexota bacterium]